MLRPQGGLQTGLTRQSRVMPYIASVSYAVHVIHHFTMLGCPSSGSTAMRYNKRRLVFAVTFGLAHLSTFDFEHTITNWARTA